MISRAEVSQYCEGRQQNCAAARALSPQFLDNLGVKEGQAIAYIDDVLSTLLPFLPGESMYEVCLVDDCNVAETVSVDDGGQLILINRHFVAFLRNFIEFVARGIRLNDDGRAMAKTGVSEDEKRLFGRGIGEYLNFGAPLSFPPSQSMDLGPDIYIAAIEFVLAHEIVHRIEDDRPEDDLELDGFQDFCRMRAREYRCDRRAVALTLARRKHLDMAEMAFLGSICALTAISWVEQFTPGFIPESWHHPGSDSRVLRIYLDEPLLWRAAGLEGHPNDITTAALRRAFRLLSVLEETPRLIASPLNHLIHHCISSGQPDHDFFETRIGEAFAQGRVTHVARALGALWGDAERMAERESLGQFDEPQGQLTAMLFSRLHDKLLMAGAAAREIAADINGEKQRRLASPEP